MSNILPVTAVFFSLQTICFGAELSRFTYTRPLMGTVVRLVLYAPDADTAKGAADAAFVRIEELNGMLSDYLPDSELSKLSSNSGGEPVKVSKELFEILNYAAEISEKSGGAFDVTVGPVVRLWRQARKDGNKPDDAAIAKANALVGYRNMKLDAKEQTVQLLKTGMILDLGALGKGFIADHALAALKAKGISRALIAAGGDIVVGDSPPDKEGWTVGVEPLKGDDSPTRHLRLKNAAVSTAGDAEQFLEDGGTRYSHIVDPKTGNGMTVRSSVTVVAERGLVSDALDTAISVMGAERGLEVIEKIPGTAALIAEDHNGTIKTRESKRWKDVPIARK